MRVEFKATVEGSKHIKLGTYLAQLLRRIICSLEGKLTQDSGGGVGVAVGVTRDMGLYISFETSSGREVEVNAVLVILGPILLFACLLYCCTYGRERFQNWYFQRSARTKRDSMVCIPGV